MYSICCWGGCSLRLGTRMYDAEYKTCGGIWTINHLVDAKVRVTGKECVHSSPTCVLTIGDRHLICAKYTVVQFGVRNVFVSKIDNRQSTYSHECAFAHTNIYTQRLNETWNIKMQTNTKNTHMHIHALAHSERLDNTHSEGHLISNLSQLYPGHTNTHIHISLSGKMPGFNIGGWKTKNLEPHIHKGGN